MAAKERARTKGGFQVCTIYPDKVLEEADAIIESEKIWISLQDYIREAVREKNERWKKEHAEKFHA